MKPLENILLTVNGECKDPEAGAHDPAKEKEVELPEWNARERGAAKATPGLT